MDDRTGSGREEDISHGEKDRTNSETPNSPRRLWQKKRIIIPLLILIFGAVAVAYYWNTYIRGYASTDDAYIDADNVTISSKILGRIAELGADEGDTVQQDQLLVSIDDSDLRAQEAQAKANLNFSEKNLSLAKINLQKAQDDFNRADMQIKGNAITREQYDHARQAVETARAQSDAAQAQIATAQAQLGVVETQLSNTKIISPFRGVVARKWLLPGDVVQAAQPILTVYDIQDSWVTAYFEETKIRVIKPGDPVDISVDAYPNRKFSGKVTEIGTTAASQFSLIPPNNASGNFTKVTQRIPIKIGINGANLDSSMPLRAGMSVEVKINVRGR
jgi:membrane fusion protein, multidrug efflux system